MTLERRHFLAGAIGLATATQTGAAIVATEGMTAWPPRESFRLWPGKPPGALATLPKRNFTMNGTGARRELWLRGVADPVVGVYRPTNPDGRALLAIPGGGYQFVSVQNEGINVARTFVPLGITVFVLGYRLPGEGWGNQEDVPLQDGQRAMRLIRANAARYGIDPAKLGCIGFSAGGLLSSSLAVASDDPVYDPVDAADQASARPGFAGLVYPVTSGDFMRVGKFPSGRFDAALRVNRRSPPLFIAHALDDPIVPLSQPMAMLTAARTAGVAVEAHFFQEGGHGFGPTYLSRDLPGSRWPDLFDKWSSRALMGGKN
ncbi:MAG: alpha/beta hydrolase [Sphingomonas bacterium]|nr:alpha/beta hydrolase [Sphingomonas bacterium]